MDAALFYLKRNMSDCNPERNWDVVHVSVRIAYEELNMVDKGILTVVGRGRGTRIRTKG